MGKNIFRLLALICSVLTFFGVGYVFYSGGSALAVPAALLPMLGVVVFSRLSRQPR